LRKNRDAVTFWAVLAIAAGLVISVWPYVYFRATVPIQDTPIVIPIKVIEALPIATPNPTSTGVQTPIVLEPKPLYPVSPKLDAKIGTITLPTLDLSWPIYEGTTETQLAKSVGHFSGSVLPGIADNSILSGHRTTVFNRLGELSKGDLVYVKTLAGTFTYEVNSFRIVKRTDKSVIVPTESGVLTLTTCYPFNFIGTTTEAYIVQAELIDSEISPRFGREIQIAVSRSKNPAVCKS
jgi:sortase A